MARSRLEDDLLRGSLYAKLPERRRRLQYALAGVEAMLRLCPRRYVSLSFGKQSIIVAHMVYAVAPDTPMFFLASSETWIMHDFATVIAAFLRLCPVRLTIVQTNNAALDITQHVDALSALHPSITWRHKPPGDPTWGWQQSRDYGDDDLQTMVNRDDYDGWLWGLAKEESRARRFTLSRRWPGQPHPTIYRYTDDKYRCCPLAEWSGNDLAAYIAEYDLPLLDAYRQWGLAARTTARVTRKAVEQGFVAMSKYYNQPTVNALCARFPELRGGT